MEYKSSIPFERPNIYSLSAGYIFAYDAQTGRVLWTHEKIIEAVHGCENNISQFTDEECEQIRSEAAHIFPELDVKALMAPRGFTLGENVKVVVDVKTKTLKMVPDEPQSLAERFANSKKNKGRKS
ncbi:MAG: hypothetical protein R2824_08420 [Saprospiraceae bacterium]